MIYYLKMKKTRVKYLLRHLNMEELGQKEFLKKYGGVLIADGVGLGKTFTSGI